MADSRLRARPRARARWCTRWPTRCWSPTSPTARPGQALGGVGADAEVPWPMMRAASGAPR